MMIRARRALLAVGMVAAAAVPLALSSAPAATAASSNNLNVTASEYLFKVAGKPVAGNTQITFKNVGNEIHMFALSEVKPGVTAKQVMTAFMSNDDSKVYKDEFVLAVEGKAR